MFDSAHPDFGHNGRYFKMRPKLNVTHLESLLAAGIRLWSERNMIALLLRTWTTPVELDKIIV